jgi:acyl-CoA synthetase (AMP-forming)/AMP-acid ligase II
MTDQRVSIDENATPWVEGLTIPQVLKETARRYPDHDALAFPRLGLHTSYREFAEQVDLAARGLVALGIKQGDHVAIWATNVPEWVVLQFATARIGAVLVNINPAYRPFELKYVLHQSDSVALFLVAKFKIRLLRHAGESAEQRVAAWPTAARPSSPLTLGRGPGRWRPPAASPGATC